MSGSIHKDVFYAPTHSGDSTDVVKTYSDVNVGWYFYFNIEQHGTETTKMPIIEVRSLFHLLCVFFAIQNKMTINLEHL
jgi:hypothetical protein